MNKKFYIVSSLGRFDFAFLNYILMSFVLQGISCANGEDSLGGAMFTFWVLTTVIFPWLLCLFITNIISFCISKDKENIMSLLIYMGWITSLFLLEMPEWLYGNLGFEILCIRTISLLFILFSNNHKYVYIIQIILCTFVHNLNIFYWNSSSIDDNQAVYDCIVSFIYISYNMCKKSGLTRCCNLIIFLMTLLLLSMIWLLCTLMINL